MPKRSKGNAHGVPMSNKKKRELLDKKRKERRYQQMEVAERLKRQKEDAEKERLRRHTPKNWRQQNQ